MQLDRPSGSNRRRAQLKCWENCLEVATAQYFARFVSRECSPFRSGTLSLTVGMVSVVQMLLLAAAARTATVAAEYIEWRLASCLKQGFDSMSSPLASARYADNERDARVLSRVTGNKLTYFNVNSDDQSPTNDNITSPSSFREGTSGRGPAILPFAAHFGQI